MSADEIIYDVFLSHQQADKKWVKKLWERLYEQEGLEVFFDEESISGGGNIPEEVIKALKNSVHVCVVLSPEYLNSAYCMAELNKSFHSDPNANARRIIPLLLRDCEVPDQIDHIKYRDFRNKEGQDYELVISKLLEDIREPVPKANTAPAREPVENHRKPLARFLCDREEQSKSLENIFFDAESEEITHPLFFILHGPEDQRIRDYINEKVIQFMLFEEINEKKISPVKFDLTWENPDQNKYEVVLNALNKNFGTDLVKKFARSKEEKLGFIKQAKSQGWYKTMEEFLKKPNRLLVPMLISNIQNWDKPSTHINYLKNWIDDWYKNLKIAKTSSAYIFLVLTYDPEQSRDAHEKIMNEMANTLKHVIFLESKQFSLPGKPGVLLEEFGNVEKEEALNWPHWVEEKKLIIWNDVVSTRDEIEKYFEEEMKSDSVSMDSLAEKLNQLIEKG